MNYMSRTQDFILLIMNCAKYRNKAQDQKSGWLQHLPSEIIYYHVLGNENLASEYEFDDTNRILFVRTPDDYNSLPYKVISAYAAIAAEYKFKYIFKTDDDQRLTDPLWMQSCINIVKEKTPDYGGRLITIHQEHISEYYHFHPELPRDIVMRRTQYCNGRFYILSKVAVEDLLKKRDVFRSEYFEDYAVGYYLDFNIKSRFLPIDNSIFVDNLA